MKYESNILERLIKTYGVVGNPKYVSEIIKQFIIQGKECYPNLFTYQADWLAHIDEFGLTPEYTVSYTGHHIYAPNTKEKPVKRAILKGSTKYRDIDTGEFLETFEKGRNLELVSVKMPVLTTSNEDGTKTNILTVNEDLELRGIGDIKDELDCLTGEVIERIGEVVLDGSEDEKLSLRLSHGLVYQGVLYNNNYISNHQLKKIYSNKIERFCIIIPSTITSISEARQWLSENNVIIQLPLAEESIKTVDLTIHDKDHQKVERLTSFEGGTHFTTSSQDGTLLPTLTVDVVTDLEETLMVCSLEGNTM